MNNSTESSSNTQPKSPNFRPLIVIILLIIFFAFMRQRTPQSHSIPPDLGGTAAVEVLTSYPHDPLAFTQGLVYWQGSLYESAGLYGQSSLRKVELATGEVLQEVSLEETYFAEGLTLLNDQLYQLTWKEQTGFIYNLSDFALVGTFQYSTEGWGLTTDGTDLILSDGTDTLYFIDPQSMQTKRTIQVLNQGVPVQSLNELEYINGEIYANIWYSDTIVRINPEDGSVFGQIDLSNLRAGEDAPAQKDVLNGIAYDPLTDRLFVTGKNWSKVYEVQLVSLPTP
ncbi:MAG: glutaminyl-peptide cyclotransferase [Anaerolineaceae bacterium]